MLAVIAPSTTVHHAGVRDCTNHRTLGERMHDLEDVIRQRRSIRMFLPDRPVPRKLVHEALELAIRAPSNSNIQPWQLFFASGAARQRLVAALLEAAKAGPPKVPPLPEAFGHYRGDTGKVVYGAMGIARDDQEARRAAVLRNWEFFRAPLAGVVCMRHELGLVDSLGVGMFLQTLVLALTARQLGSCVQVAIAGYPEVLRQQLGIPDQFTVLCGLSVGYPDPEFAANHIRLGRDPVEQKVVFLDN
jgi:nitroreductase